MGGDGLCGACRLMEGLGFYLGRNWRVSIGGFRAEGKWDLTCGVCFFVVFLLFLREGERDS